MRRRAEALRLVVLLVSCVAAGLAAAPARSHDAALRTQALVVLLHAHGAYVRPARSSRRLGIVSATRPLTGERTVLPVLGRQGPWLRVLLPGRPNGHTGWIDRARTRAATTAWHLVVRLSQRRVVVFRGGRAVRSFVAIVGKPSTPTPEGAFFVEEDVALRAGDVGGPFALALSARSEVLQEFDGGPGQIAIHGLRNVGGVLGTAVSHGCVRLADDAMHWLVLRIGPGVRVTIRK